jgi:hypothetical protein
MIVVKRFLLFAVPSLFCLHTYAQKAKLEWGDMEKKSKFAPALVRILKGPPNELITVSFKAESGKTITPILARFDKDLNQVAEKELSTSESNVYFHSVHNLKDQIFLFTRKYDKDEKFTSLHSTQIDPQTLQITGTKELGSFEAISKKKQADISIRTSADTSSILVFAAAPYNKKENEKFYIGVWDSKMNKQWDKLITLPYEDKYITLEGFEVSNEGEVYVMCKHYDKEVKRERVREDGEDVPSYKYKILIYAKNENNPKEYTIDFQNKFVHDVALQFNSDGNINLVGLYKNKYNGKVTGSFITALDKKTKQVNVKKMEEFPIDDLLTLLDKDNVASNGSKDPGLHGRFKIMGTNKRNDGSIDLLTEYNYWYIVRSRQSNGWYTEYPVYVANDIVVINYKKDGKVAYTRVPKYQREANTNVHISFKWMNQNDKLLLFFNDDKDNVDRDLSKKPDDVTNFKKSVFVMAVINGKGDLQRQAAYSNSDLELATKITSCEVISSDALILYAEKLRLMGKTSYQFGRLKLL